MALTEHHQVVSVDRNGRGNWEVSLPDGRTLAACETLDNARRLAFLHAERALPCELIIRDAYHRVVDHEVIDRSDAPAASSPA